MKKLTLIFTLILIIFSSPVHAEKYTCIYKEDEKSKTLTETRVGDLFQKHEGYTSSIKDNDEYIILYHASVGSNLGVALTTIIRKSDLTFVRTEIFLGGERGYPQPTGGIIRGTCTVTM